VSSPIGSVVLVADAISRTTRTKSTNDAPPTTPTPIAATGCVVQRPIAIQTSYPRIISVGAK
jgi:hypothetical protein